MTSGIKCVREHSFSTYVNFFEKTNIFYPLIVTSNVSNNYQKMLKENNTASSSDLTLHCLATFRDQSRFQYL